MYLFHAEGKTSHGMTQGKRDKLAPLLLAQEYIHGVHFVAGSDAFDSSLNGFRDHGGAGNLADMHLSTHGLGWEHRQRKWLAVEPRHKFAVICARTSRYQNPRFPWARVLEKYRNVIGFIGLAAEHKDFAQRFGDIPFVEANDFMAIAQIVAGSRLYIGNQTSITAVAEGLKHTMIVEAKDDWPCAFQRLGCVLCFDNKVELPDV